MYGKDIRVQLPACIAPLLRLPVTPSLLKNYTYEKERQKAIILPVI
jgi:hypothetical protein